MTIDPSAPEGPPTPGTGNPAIRLDSSELKSTYCNVCNATSTREEVVLNFGLNESWEQNPAEFMVRLQHRIILSPFAARRLNTILTELLEQHDKRYGPTG